MKTTTSLTAIGLVLVTNLALSTSGYAAAKPRNSDAGKPTLAQHDQPMQSQSARQKMQMSERKLAAKRLKKIYSQAREQHMQQDVERHRAHKGGN